MIRLSNAALEGAPAAGRPRRVPALDVARGIAVVAMVAYHAAWDLSALRLWATDITAEPAWQAFARAIAGTFLFLAGAGLVLAHGEGIRLRAFLKRLLTLALAAGLVTLGTWLVFPDAYVFFGILHAIAVACVLALPFSRLPALGAVGAALAIGAVPFLPPPPFADWPALRFLGLGPVPVTNDWVPVFPWAAALFAGVAAAKLGRAGLARLPEPGRIGRTLAALGRHSLVVYLLHQPILFGALSGLAALTGPNPEALSGPFVRSCRQSCTEQGQSEALCRRTCDCAAAALRDDALWPRILSGVLAPEESRRLGETAQSCFRRERDGS